MTYEESTAVTKNPERGFYNYVSLTTASDLSSVSDGGNTLIYAPVFLDDYLGSDHEQALPQSLLQDIQSGFDAVRAAGLKAIVRFMYDNGEGYPDGANDAPLSWMVQHVEQLSPVLQANADVLFMLQAGFIGAWGEWHTSNNFVDGPDDQADRKSLIDALLLAVPKNRRTGVRYPAYKRMFYGAAATTEAQMLAQDDVARVGHINDCFVSGPEDVGTYQYEPVETLRDYLAEDTKFVPMGGETCALHERGACATVVPEMERFHFTYINEDFHEDVVALWDTEGCRPEIERRLGYRLVLESAQLPTSVKPGGTFTFELNLKNVGFAALTNPRPVFLVLEGKGERLSVELEADPRTWYPGAITVAARVRIPATLEGSYRLALWMPDAEADLAERADYSIQLANEGVWVSGSGDNTLKDITVSSVAEGDADSGATAFELLP